MELTLKNVKMHDDMSDETQCFSATMYADGVKVGTVSNRGHGGPNEYAWSNVALGKQVEQWAQEQVLEFDFEKLDQLIDTLVFKYERLKILTRHLKKKTLFRLVGDEPHTWRTVSYAFSPEIEAFIVKKYGTQVQCIANKDLHAALAYG